MLDFRSVKYFKLATNASEYKESDNVVACRCPICGDSKTRKNAKRLNLYTKDGVDTDFVSCFNAGCPCENKTIYSFLRDFYPDLLPRYKKEVFHQKIDTLKQASQLETKKIKTFDFENSEIADKIESSNSNNSKNTENEFDFMNTEIADKKDTSNNSSIVVNKEPLLYDLKPFFKPLTPEAIEYLKNRLITPRDDWFIAKTDINIGDTLYKIKDFLIIPLYKDNLMYGFYSRSLHKKTFITFISTTGYKVWNWFNIDKNKEVFITEAIFDGISTGLQNIIANLGAKLPQDRLDELKQPVFCLDNDKTGIENSIKYSEQGYKVFIMPNKYHEKDFNELKLKHPDLNISELVKNNIYKGISAITRLKLKL